MIASLTLLLAVANPANAERFAFDDREGEVTFETDSSLHTIHGQASNFTGEVNLNGAEPITGELTIQSAAIDTGLGLRDKRLWNYVLETAKYPTLSIELLDLGGDKAGFATKKGTGEIELLGKLKMRSTEREVSIPCTYTWVGDKVTLDGAYVFDWTDWNLPDPSIPLARMHPEVRAAFKVTAKKRP